MEVAAARVGRTPVWLAWCREVGSEALVHELCALIGIPDARLAHEACIDCGVQHARPVLIGETATIRHAHVSLAHAAAITLCALTLSDAPIGVDLEANANASHAARALEAERIRPRHALRQWTIREAVLKADGRGLRVDPASVTVRRRRAIVPDSPGSYRHATLRLIAQHTLSVAVRED